nr:hypothetical protein [Tanacetum cinerariifolium]
MIQRRKITVFTTDVPKKIIKTIHVDFDELAAMASKKSLEPALHEMTPATPSSGLVPNPPLSAPFVPPSRNEWDLVFPPVFDEFFTPPSSVASSVHVEEAPASVVSTDLPSSTTVDQNAPSPNVPDRIMTSKAQQVELDNALVAPENYRVIGKCNMRINLGIKPNEPIYQVALDALALTTCYHAFLITAEVPVIYMHQFWATVTKHNSSYRFKIDNKKFSVNVEVKNLDFVALIWEDLAYQIDNIDSKKQDKMFYTRFTKIIIHRFLDKDKSISIRNRTFMHTARDNILLDFVAYKTYYAIALGAKPPKSRKSQKKSDSAISSEESPSKKKSTKAKKVIATKPKPTKKKEPIKADRGKGTDEGTGTILGVLVVPNTILNVRKNLGGNSREKGNDDENDSKDESNNGDNNDDDRIKIYVLNRSSTEYYEEEEEKFDDDDEEKMDGEEDDDVTKELYKDVNVNLGNKDAD